eukprot:g18301.t1
MATTVVPKPSIPTGGNTSTVAHLQKVSCVWDPGGRIQRASSLKFVHFFFQHTSTLTINGDTAACGGGGTSDSLPVVPPHTSTSLFSRVFATSSQSSRKSKDCKSFFANPFCQNAIRGLAEGGVANISLSRRQGNLPPVSPQVDGEVEKADAAWRKMSQSVPSLRPLRQVQKSRVRLVSCAARCFIIRICLSALRSSLVLGAGTLCYTVHFAPPPPDVTRYSLPRHPHTLLHPFSANRSQWRLKSLPRGLSCSPIHSSWESH